LYNVQVQCRPRHNLATQNMKGTIRQFLNEKVIFIERAFAAQYQTWTSRSPFGPQPCKGCAAHIDPAAHCVASAASHHAIAALDAASPCVRAKAFTARAIDVRAAARVTGSVCATRTRSTTSRRAWRSAAAVPARPASGRGKYVQHAAEGECGMSIRQ
jgi:hypothetical protein